MQKNIVNKQQGMTFIGLVLTIAAILSVVAVGIKVTPAYIEFFGVKKIISKIGNESNFKDMSKKEIQEMFSNGATIGYVTVVNANDLIIERGESGNVVTAAYQVTIPLIANASILLDFNATTAKSELLGRKAKLAD